LVWLYREKRDQQKLKMSCLPFAQGRSVQPGRPVILFRIRDHCEWRAGFDGRIAGVAAWTTAAALRWWSR